MQKGKQAKDPTQNPSTGNVQKGFWEIIIINYRKYVLNST